MKGKRRFIFSLICLTLAFIWSRSAKPKAASAAESGAVLDFMKQYLRFLSGRITLTDHLVRKLAHLCEYGLLGVEVAAWRSLQEQPRWGRGLLVAFGFLVGTLDETIQLFVGRGNQFSDVLLDLFGFICGLYGLWLLLWLYGKRKKKDGE